MLSNDTHKECRNCRDVKLKSEYYVFKKNTDGLHCYCKDCIKTQAREGHTRRKETDPSYRDRKRSAHFKHVYGLNLATYKQKLVDQGSVCTICKTELLDTGPLTHLDHCHSTGNLRDFLCTNCNRGLGSFKDNTEILMNAINYLNTHRDNAESKGRADVYGS